MLRWGRVGTATVGYIVGFGLAAWADLYTTVLALQREGASEGNVYANVGGAYDIERATAFSAVGGLFIGAFFLVAALTAGKISEVWLTAPIRSFAKLYLNPFARRNIEYGPLHILAYCLAFPILRLLAVVNNLLIFHQGWGPFGSLIGILSHYMPGAIAFWAVMGPAFILLTMAMSPAAARLSAWISGRSI